MEKRFDPQLREQEPLPQAVLRVAQRTWKGIIFVVEELVPVITLVITVLAIMIQVFYRYVLDAPLTWPFELSIYAFVWTLYLGAAHATRTEDHVRLDIVYNAMPMKVRRFFDTLFNLIITVVFIAALPTVWDYLQFSYRIKTVALKLPWTYVFGVFPIFMVLVVIHNIEHIVRDVKLLLTKETEQQEP